MIVSFLDIKTIFVIVLEHQEIFRRVILFMRIVAILCSCTICLVTLFLGFEGLLVSRFQTATVLVF